MEESGTVSNKLGKGITALRKENGLSQIQFAERVGISQTYVSDLESGKKNPTMKTLDDLLSYFDTDYIEFAQTYILDEKPQDSLNVGSGLKQLRKDKQLTQDELATMTGIARAYISAIESGRRNPTTETINNILTELGTTYIDFLIDYCGVKRETEPQSPLEQNFNKLTPENQKQVSDFVEFLISKQ